MARHTEVGQYTIELLHTVVAHPVTQVAEVAAHEGETLVVHDVALGIGILVEAVEAPRSIHAAQYLTRVTATAEGHVGIHAALLDGQPVDRLVQHHGNMIRNIH